MMVTLEGNDKGSTGKERSFAKHFAKNSVQATV